MLIEKVGINASPLITLFRVNLHPLLPFWRCGRCLSFEVSGPDMATGPTSNR